MIKTAFIFGGTYALGSIAGGKIADVAGFGPASPARTGTKIGAGVIAFVVLSSLLK